MKLKILIPITIIVLALICFASVSYMKNLETRVATLNNSLDSVNRVLAETLAKLVSDDERLVTLEKQNSSLASSQQRIQSESASQLAALKSALSNTQSGLDLSSIIKSWRPYIVRISCTIDTPTEIAETNGSGLLARTSTYPYAHLITNRHVVKYDGYSPQDCRVTFPDISGTISVSGDAVRFPNKATDIGIVDISKKSDVVDLRGQNSVNRKVCSSVLVGEKVVILGYPSIGSKNDITATEGIISGQDGDYYITSAKIEQGNSGGAAILVRGPDTCYLGIPTFASVGKIEALARILSARVLE